MYVFMIYICIYTYTLKHQHSGHKFASHLFRGFHVFGSRTGVLSQPGWREAMTANGSESMACTSLDTILEEEGMDQARLLPLPAFDWLLSDFFRSLLRKWDYVYQQACVIRC